MLGLLETRLGLLRAECTQAQRMTQYRECLKRCDTPNRFYHASFEVDPIGASASLLSWRDNWYLHGWTGEAPSGASVRIADMAAVEQIARHLLFPSIGERLVQVAESLSLQQSKIEQLELVDPIEAFPKCWRAVLAKLPVQSVRTYGPLADETTVLGRLQIALKSAHEGKKLCGKIAWKDDGSLRVVRAEEPIGHQDVKMDKATKVSDGSTSNAPYRPARHHRGRRTRRAGRARRRACRPGLDLETSGSAGVSANAACPTRRKARERAAREGLLFTIGKEWILGPDRPYEREGDVPNVVFPCGLIHDEPSGQVRLYYGAADTSVCVATAQLDDLLAAVLAAPG